MKPETRNLKPETCFRIFGLSPNKHMKPLHTCPVGTQCRILSVTGEDSCVRRANELGLVEGVCCSIERRAPFDGPVEISMGRSRLGVRLGNELSILVEVLDAAHQQLMRRQNTAANVG